MAQLDLVQFMQERMAAFDETVDTTPGSPFDTQVVQPLLARIGTDPLTVPVADFIRLRLQQEFPELAISEGDAITDQLIKPMTLLLEPVVREIKRIKLVQSIQNPDVLTLDEATALSANYFVPPDPGGFAKVTVRIFYSTPQLATVTPSNFLTAPGNLHFFPVATQTVSKEEMQINFDAASSLYYFDIDAIAEAAGSEYNVAAGTITAIANLPSAVLVTNSRKARSGLPADDSSSLIQKAADSLTERNLVTQPGIRARIAEAFGGEVTHVTPIGAGDPEMKRDIVVGGGLGPLRASGLEAEGQPDGENQTTTRRLQLLEAVTVDTPNGLLDVIGSATIEPEGWVITVFDGFGGVPPTIRDLDVKTVVSATMLDLVDQVIVISGQYPWSLRRKEITLSEIPGGILVPDTPDGTVSIPDGTVHIGSMEDIYVQGASPDASSLVLTSIVGDEPQLEGVSAEVPLAGNSILLNDLVLGTDFADGDSTDELLQLAMDRGWTLELLEGPAAGGYRISSVITAVATATTVVVSPAPPFAATPDFANIKWRIVSTLDIDLVEPKETRIQGTDLITVQGTAIVETGAGDDFDILGVAEGDILRIEVGPDKGDYTIESLVPPFTLLTLDRELTFTNSNLTYRIFKKNPAGGVTLPLLRVTSIELLDSNQQPIGTRVPYGRIVEVRSRAFANAGRGVRFSARDGRLGLVSQSLPAGANVTGKTLNIQYNDGTNIATIVFSGGDPVSVANIISQINTGLGATMAVSLPGDRFGLIPFGFTELLGGTAFSELFGQTDDQYMSSRELNSDELLSSFPDWAALEPDIDGDVVNVVTGPQAGHYRDPQADFLPDGLLLSRSVGLTVAHDFAPEVGVTIEFGARSLGSARTYFLEPTTVEFDANTVFSANVNGLTLKFIPDPKVESQLLPGLPSGTKPKDGDNLTVPSTTVMQSATDFIAKGVLPGDILQIDYIPLTGANALPDPIPALQFLTLVLSINDSPDKTITFLQDSTSIPSGSVTRTGVANQINTAVGRTICSIIASGGSYYLEFEADAAITIRTTGTATSALLGAPFTSADTNNDSGNKGRYVVRALSTSSLTIDSFPPVGFLAAFAVNEVRQQFKIFRPATQRVGTTEMNENTEEPGLFYADVQLVSEGTGDRWNIDGDVAMTAEGYSADGYYLTTTSDVTSFSPFEQITLHLSGSILTVGVPDEVDNKVQLTAQNLLVSYEHADIVAAVDTFARSEEERVVVASPLGRHAIPVYVRFALEYSGGSRESVVGPRLTELVRGAGDTLEAAEVVKVVQAAGATSVKNPIDLVGVVHNQDRSITISRSKDRLQVGRLAAMIPDQITIKRNP